MQAWKSVHISLPVPSLQIHLVRDVDGQQFSDAIDKVLLPKMTLMGEPGCTGPRCRGVAT